MFISFFSVLFNNDVAFMPNLNLTLDYNNISFELIKQQRNAESVKRNSGSVVIQRKHFHLVAQFSQFNNRC